MPGSTLWPGLLLLHLRAEDGVMVVLPVLPDSVSAGLFRPLSVACRTIAARSGDLT
jgi:toxin CptA